MADCGEEDAGGAVILQSTTMTASLGLGPTPPSILIWNDDYDMIPDLIPSCDQPFRLLFDHDSLPSASAVVFHVPTLRRLPRIKAPGQRWVAWSMESDVNYPALTDPALGAVFDLSMTYRRDADVWAPYLPPSGYPPHDGLAGLRAWRAADDLAPVVYIASNQATATRRDVLVSVLMEHLRVDSYGKSLNNRSWERDEGRPTLRATIARYPFTIAIENSISVDYVTEKFFEPLQLGSVPVYLGAPNIEDFAPDKDCFVDIRKFSGPAALAAYLLEATEDDTTYARHHRWRTEGTSPRYRALADIVAVHALCRLARLLAHA